MYVRVSIYTRADPNAEDSSSITTVLIVWYRVRRLRGVARTILRACGGVLVDQRLVGVHLRNERGLGSDRAPAAAAGPEDAEANEGEECDADDTDDDDRP